MAGRAARGRRGALKPRRRAERTLGALTAAIGLGSPADSVLLLRLARRPNEGEPQLALSTVVVQAMSTDDMRARAMAIWAGAFVGVLPIGALITRGLAELLGAAVPCWSTAW